MGRQNVSFIRFPDKKYFTETNVKRCIQKLHDFRQYIGLNNTEYVISFVVHVIIKTHYLDGISLSLCQLIKLIDFDID